MAMRQPRPDISWSLEAEMAAIGSILLNGNSLHEVDPLIGAGDFVQGAHQIIYAAILALFRQGKDFSDPVVLKNFLSSEGNLENAGGGAYLIQLMEAVPTASNAVYYASIVRDKATQRRLEHASANISAICRDSELNAQEKCQKALNLIEAIAFRENTDKEHDLGDLVFNLPKDLKQGTPTGLRMIDYRSSAGGLYPDEPNIIAGAKGTGKTNFMVQMAIRAARHGKSVRFASVELRAQKVVRRVMRQLCGYSSEDKAILAGAQAEWAAAQYEASGWNFKIWDAAQADITVEGLMARLCAAHARKPVDLFVLDYAQLLDSRECPIVKGKTQAMERIEHHLRRVNARLGNVFLIGSQLSGNADQGYYTANSTEFGKGASAVYHLLRDDEKAFRLFCDKCRDDKDKWSEPLIFDSWNCTFKEPVVSTFDREEAPVNVSRETPAQASLEGVQ